MYLNDSGHHEMDICGFEWNVSTTIGWIAMKFGTDIQDELVITLVISL